MLLRSFAVLLIAGAAPALVAQTPPATTQQMFDAGTAAMDASDWAKALEIYSNLETRLANSKSARSKAIVQLRRGTLLWRLRRDDAAAAQLLVKALDALPASDPSLAKDRFDALLTLGSIATADFDYAAASGYFRKAAAADAASGAKVVAYNRLVAIGMFVDPAQALADADALLALLAVEAKVDPEWRGLAHGLRGRVLLNLQRPADARTELAKATRLLGGLNYGKINLSDISARSDAAIAEFRTGQVEAARRLLSLSGAAMQSNQGFIIGSKMQPPDCDPARGLRPDDVAVIEFSIRDDGTVGAALPIYFSGKPAFAIDFARAVSGWTWTADELAKVSPVFRLQTRLEMRCSTTARRPNAFSMLWPGVETWVKSRGVTAISLAGQNDAEIVASAKRELARREAEAAGSVATILPLIQLASSPVFSFDEARGYAGRALDVARKHTAPPPVLAYFELLAARFENDSYDGNLVGKYQRRLSAAIGNAAIASDATARNALTIALYDSLSQASRKRDGRALIAGVTEDASIAANDPYKVGALIRLANIEAEAGRIADARTLFEKSGLSAQQCALVDAAPKHTGGTIGSSDYPREALNWGFGGWTVVEFDIDAAGRTQNVRPLIAFPPFVFGEPTAAQIRGFRYTQSYRPEGGLGCGGQQQRVTYRSGISG